MRCSISYLWIYRNIFCATVATLDADGDEGWLTVLWFTNCIFLFAFIAA